MIGKIMQRSLVKGAALLALGAALASCSGRNFVSLAPPPPPPDAFAVFGTGFATDFHDGVVSLTSDPVVPAAGDIIPLSLTTDPVNPLPSPAS